ncbi:Fe/S biogenesis protein NfuA [Frankliniella fusca]|uniref:Fe/S biogenesis protein NfuA n=1 Tax=Frankliniella fusca TaxID=407009 RepID=A0AAE1GVP0_9NEOP|nr:Fe/S biogenesis protein NfuA [Frankliniella fusca]
MYDLQKERVAFWLSNQPCIIITCDVWTETQTTTSYLGVTTHVLSGTKMMTIFIGTTQEASGSNVYFDFGTSTLLVHFKQVPSRVKIILRSITCDRQAGGNIMLVQATKKDMVLVHGLAGCSGWSFLSSRAAQQLRGGKRPGLAHASLPV